MLCEAIPMPIRGIAAVLSLAFAVTSSAHAQTHSDIAASVYGAFTGTVAGNGTVQSPSNQAGGILELRHIANPLVGYEITYSFNRANQSYNFTEVKADAHEVSLDWVVSVPLLNFRPFVLAGIGGVYFHPDGAQPGTLSEAKLVYVYGGGIDWNIIPHFGFRGQYRGNLYHAPDLLAAASSTRAFAHTAEPMLGIYFRF
jgi:opacity protein-like surface antigen